MATISLYFPVAKILCYTICTKIVPLLQTWRELLLGQNFTQDEVDMNTVRYVHTGGREKSSTDFFVFQVNDGQHRMPKETFDIEIISSKGKEIAVLNKGLAVKEGDSK